MYESHAEAPLPTAHFLRRLVRHAAGALALVAASLGIGMAGYHYLEQLGWLDAFLNAAMLLGGMGPVDAPRTAAGKLFAGFYALYCGLVVIVSVGFIAAPLLHRALHKFHWRKDATP